MKIIRSLSEWMVYAAVVLVIGMMLLTVSDVSLRYAFSNPITGTTEIIEYGMVCLLVGVVPAAIAGRHIRVDAVIARLKPRAQAILEIILHALSLGIMVVVTWRGLVQGLLVNKYHGTSSMLAIPKFPFYVVLVVSFGMLCLAIIALLVQRIVEVAKR